MNYYGKTFILMPNGIGLITTGNLIKNYNQLKDGKKNKLLYIY